GERLPLDLLVQPQHLHLRRALVAVLAEGHGEADPRIELLDALERGDELLAREVTTGPAEALEGDSSGPEAEEVVLAGAADGQAVRVQLMDGVTVLHHGGIGRALGQE